ncbi:arpin-like isoform X2 [Solea solea]|uniref:arpin-like isoform X2 n=1 Tax=Solea solea TaxID=90069 RepID=UPI00272AFE39|nr:arpin-like isoform X2 [Solea solea]
MIQTSQDPDFSGARLHRIQTSQDPDFSGARLHRIHTSQDPQKSLETGSFWGAGVLLEGKVLDVSRHVVSDVKNHKVRFYVLYVKPSRVHQRKFDDRGNEIEPNFSDTKKVNTGHLLSSYISIAKVEGGAVTRCNFTGDENTGASWTDKILANKVHAEDAERGGGGGGAAGGGEGADEDEWDERVNHFLAELN